MLGLGLGLHKSTMLLSNLKLLTRNSDWAICGDKATGTSKGTNSPQVNPIVDLVGVVGKNLFDPITVFQGGLTSTTGTINTSLLTRVCSQVIKLNPLAQFTMKVNNTNYKIRNWAFYNNDVWISSGSSDTQVQEFTSTIPSNCNGVRISFCKNVLTENLTPQEFQNSQTQLELGTTATAYEPYGKANGLLQGFGFIPTSGYADVVAPNGKTVTGLQGDGVNDVILLPSNAPNPTTGNFAFGLVVKTGANKIKYWLTRNATNDADTQYAFKMDASGNLFVILEGVAIQIGTALSVGFHSIWLERDSGTLKAFIDGIETYTGAHAVTLTSRPNTVMMASTTGAGTYTGFSNDLLLASKYCDSDIAKNRADWFKFDTKAYGL